MTGVGRMGQEGGAAAFSGPAGDLIDPLNTGAPQQPAYVDRALREQRGADSGLNIRLALADREAIRLPSLRTFHLSPRHIGCPTAETA